MGNNRTEWSLTNPKIKSEDDVADMLHVMSNKNLTSVTNCLQQQNFITKKEGARERGKMFIFFCAHEFFNMQNTINHKFYLIQIFKAISPQQA